MDQRYDDFLKEPGRLKKVQGEVLRPGSVDLIHLRDHVLDWENIDNKPSAFNPSVHSHGWDEVTNRPDAYPPSVHSHDERYYTEAEIDAMLNFLQLSDTPISYSGHGGKYVAVKSSEDGLEFVTGSGGSSTFLGLTDTPGSYSNYARYYVAVNSSEDGLEFVKISPGTFIGLTDTPIDYAGSDDRILRVNSTPDGIEFGANLNHLDDINVSPSDNDVLSYDSVTSKWKNLSPVNLLADLSGQAGAAFNWNSQNLTSVGIITSVSGKYMRTTDDDVTWIQGASVDYKGASLRFFGGGNTNRGGDIYLDFGDFTQAARAGAAFVVRAMDNGGITTVFKIGLDGSLYIYDTDDNVFRKVSFGPDDSMGTGYKGLRVPN